jgi:hypothetical protein
MAGWWPPGHQLGWEHLHANLIHEFLLAVAGTPMTDTAGASFEDGFRVAVVSAAIRRPADRPGDPVSYA